MPDGPGIDTDVLLKAAAFQIADELVEVLAPHGRPAALGLTHLIAQKQLARKRGVRDGARARAQLQALLMNLDRLEPNENEIALAARLSEAAQLGDLPLDAGEAQLAAIVIQRRLPLLVSGDKRALGALAQVLAGTSLRPALVNKLACFEQLVSSISGLIGPQELRQRICAEPEVDGAMRIACSCGSSEWNPSQFAEACASYANAVRKDADDLLLRGSMLT